MEQQSKTLGEFLRELRKKAKVRREEQARGYKQVTQTLLAERLNLSYSTHISEIENGKHFPSSDMVERWVHACDGTPEDLYKALAFIQALPIAPLPNGHAIITVLEPLIPRLAEICTPAYIVDNRNTVWAANSATAMYHISYGDLIANMRRPLNLLEWVFDSRLKSHSTVHELERHQFEQILQFRTINLRRQHEPFYRKFRDQMAAKLLPRDAVRFVTVWDKPEPELQIVHSVNIAYSLTPHCVASFRIFDSNIRNFDDMFGFVRYDLDADQTSDIECVKQYFAPLCDLPVVKLWDLIDVDDLLERYRTGVW